MFPAVTRKHKYLIAHYQTNSTGSNKLIRVFDKIKLYDIEKKAQKTRDVLTKRKQTPVDVGPFPEAGPLAASSGTALRPGQVDHGQLGQR